jgi:hypothetical protein
MFGLDLFFSIFCFISFLVFLWSASSENPFACIASMVIYFAALQFIFKYNVLGYLQNNFGFILTCFACYLALGVFWAFFKWYFLLKQKVSDRDELINEYFISKGLLESDPQLCQEIRISIIKGDKKEELKAVLHDFGKFLYEQGKSESLVKPNISNYRSSFISWFVFWPFSILIFLFKDFARQLGLAIYYRFARQLQKIADNIWDAN